MDNNDYVNGLGFCCNPSEGTTSGGSSTGKMTAKNDNAELQQFYYHPDHLGSSSYISNLDGEVVQHVEYVPFGEVFLEEKNAKWNTPYLFNAKELDKESGMYYYGARYYDPKTSIWASVDPMMLREEVFNDPESTNGGVYNDQNLAVYAFSYNNPVKYVDPDGECPSCIWGAVIGASVDYGLQVAVNFAEGKRGSEAFTNVNVTSILVSAGAGALSGGISSIKQIKNASTVVKIGVDITTNAGVSVASQAIKKGEVSLQDTAIDVVIGTVASVGGGMVEKKLLNSSTGKKLTAAINAEKNIARGKSNVVPKSKANVSGAAKKLEKYVGTRAAATASVSSGTASTAVTKLQEKNKKK